MMITNLSRIKKNSKAVITGDIGQPDGQQHNQCPEISLPMCVTIENGRVYLAKGKKLLLGSEEKLGSFANRDGKTYVKPHNGLCHALMLYSASDEFKVAVLDDTDIHRHDGIGVLLALDEAAAVPGRKYPSVGRARGSLDTDSVIIETETRRNNARKSHLQVVSHG